MRSAETRDVVGGSTDGGCKSQEAISTLMSRSPRLETNSGSNSSTLPPTAYHPSLMLASTELGVYIKWALLLQEQLEHVQAERAGLAQHCSRLQTDNHQLRRMLVAEDPAKYGSLSTPEGDSQECAEQTAAADEASEQDSAQTEGSNELTPTLPEAPKAAARQPLGNAQGPDVLNSPNLRMLANFLKEAPQDGASFPMDSYGHSSLADGKNKRNAASPAGATASKLLRTKPPSGDRLSLEEFDKLAMAGKSGQLARNPVARLRAASKLDAHAS